MKDTNNIKGIEIGVRIENTEHLKTKNIKDSILEIDLKDEKCKLICKVKYANKDYIYADIIGAEPLENKE